MQKSISIERATTDTQTHRLTPAEPHSPLSWPWAPQHMALDSRLPAHPPCCKWGCWRNLVCCPPCSCFREISQSWVIQVQSHCSRSRSTADLGRRPGGCCWVTAEVGGCPGCFPRRCLHSWDREEGGHHERTCYVPYHQPPLL